MPRLLKFLPSVGAKSSRSRVKRLAKADHECGEFALRQCGFSGERVSEQFAVPHRGVIAMYKHILIATDGSGRAQKAEATGLTLAKSLNAQACAVTVTEPWDPLSMAALAERGIPNPVADYDE